MPSSDPQDVASSSGAASEPSTSSSTGIPGLATVVILSVAVDEITEEDISLRPITDPRAALVQVLVDLFFLYLRKILPILLQDTRASEAIIMILEGQASFIRHFDVLIV